MLLLVTFDFHDGICGYYSIVIDDFFTFMIKLIETDLVASNELLYLVYFGLQRIRTKRKNRRWGKRDEKMELDRMLVVSTVVAPKSKS